MELHILNFMKFANVRNAFENIDIMWMKYQRCWSVRVVKGQQIGVYLPRIYMRYQMKLHTSCEIIRWESESTVLELSENFKGEWGNGGKTGELQVILQSPNFIIQSLCGQ